MKGKNMDIFISYRTTDGTSLGRALKEYFEQQNYGVYFNPDEQQQTDFTEELRDSIIQCKDFIILFTKGYRERLLDKKENKFIFNEIITAKENGKNIIGLISEDTLPPSEEEEWPEEIKELICRLPYIKVSNDFHVFVSRPVDKLLGKLNSMPELNDTFRDVFNSNPLYDVLADVQKQKEAAKNGSVDAMYEYANMCFYTFGYTKNLDDAYKYMLKLAEGDNQYSDYSKNMIGHMYYSGTVPHQEQSYQKSLSIHLSLKDRLYEAATHAAYMLSIGSGCEFNYDRTVEYFQSVIENGDAAVKFNFANFYMKYGKFKEAAEIYRSLSSVNTDALIALGKMYKLGLLSDPPKPDYEKAEQLFLKAIRKGSESSELYYELGTLYFNPTGDFEKDFAEAAKNFAKATELGHKEAPYILGYMYDNGHLGGRNVEKAIFYHEKAAERGQAASCEALAMLYQQPECVNYHKAFRYAEAAAKSGRCMGLFYYANLLFFGRGCEPDMDKAYYYYSKALAHGFVQAEFMMKKIDAIRKNQE